MRVEDTSALKLEKKKKKKKNPFSLFVFWCSLQKDAGGKKKGTKIEKKKKKKRRQLESRSFHSNPGIYGHIG